MLIRQMPEKPKSSVPAGVNAFAGIFFKMKTIS
jgi:hypothetical protein